MVFWFTFIFFRTNFVSQDLPVPPATMRKELQHTLLSRLCIYRLSSWLLKEVHELCCTQRVTSCLHIVLIVAFSNWFILLIARYNISAKNIINDDNSEYFSYLYLSIWILIMPYPPLFSGQCVPHLILCFTEKHYLISLGIAVLYCSDSRIQDRMKKGPHLVFSEHAILYTLALNPRLSFTCLMLAVPVLMNLLHRRGCFLANPTSTFTEMVDPSHPHEANSPGSWLPLFRRFTPSSLSYALFPPIEMVVRTSSGIRLGYILIAKKVLFLFYIWFLFLHFVFAWPHNSPWPAWSLK